MRLRTATLAAALLLGSITSTASATIITPSTTADDITNNGNCTLREAVQAANTDAAVDQCPAGSGPDVIQLGTGTYDLGGASKENANQSGDLDVTAPLTIQGTGTSATTIDAQQNDRVLDTVAGAATTIENLTLTNGAAPTAGTLISGGTGESGGAVRSISPLTLTDVDVLNSHAADGRTGNIVPGTDGNPGGNGGGVWGLQQITITGGSFVGDHAGSGSGGSGGMSASSGSGNRGGDAGDGGQAGAGGAIFAAGGLPLTVSGTTFRSDHAGAGGAGGGGGSGGSKPGGTGGDGGNAGNGAVGGDGGATDAIDAVTLSGITTSDTQAGAGGDGGKGGPGGSGSSQANSGSQGTNGNGAAGGSGGAVAVGTGSITVSGAQLSSATAGAGGGGPQVVEPSPGGGGLAGAGGAGGAVSAGIGVHVDHTVISNAHAGAGGQSSTMFSPSTVAGAGGAGGGINGTSVTVSDTTITGSAAGAGGPGGDAQFASAGSGGLGGAGGGVHAAGALSLTGVTLDHDSAGAGGAGGGIGGGSSHADGGTGGAGGGVLAEQGGSIATTTLDGDAAGAGGADGAAGSNGHGGDAGGIRAPNAALTISHVTVVGSSPGTGAPAQQGSSIPAGADGSVGGISGPATVTSSVVAGNTAPQCAGTANAPDNVSFPDASCGGVNADPKLRALADNGGLTKTLLPGPGSSALDRGSCSGTDQRGVSRPQGSACDSGAVEAANPALAANGLDFGTVSQGGAATRTTTVHTTFDPLTPQASLSDPDFSRVSDGCSGVALAPAAACSIQVKFTAPTTLGPHFATLHLAHDAAGPATDVQLSVIVVDTAPPVISGLTLMHRTFRVAKRKAPPKGTTIRFNLSEAATVKFAVTQKVPGRRKGRRCVAPTKKLRHAKHCTRTVTLGRFTRSAGAGASSIPFNGRVNGRKLKPGSYTLTVSATDLAGNHGAPASVAFKIVKR